MPAGPSSAPVPMCGNCPEPAVTGGRRGRAAGGGPAVGLTASPAPGGPQASVFDLQTITRLLLQPGILPVFVIKVVCGFPFGESCPPGGRSPQGYDRATALPVPLPCVLCSGPPLSQPHRSHAPGEGRPWQVEMGAQRPPLHRSPEARACGAVPPLARGPLGRWRAGGRCRRRSGAPTRVGPSPGSRSSALADGAAAPWAGGGG